MRRKRPIGCEELEKIVDKILLFASNKKPIALSSNKALEIAQLYFDHKHLQDEFRRQHFELLGYINRHQKAYKILLRKEIPPISTAERRKEILKLLGLDKRKTSISDVYLFYRYANLIRGYDVLTGEITDEGSMDKWGAIETLSSDLGITYQAVIDKLKRAISRMKKKNIFPEEFKGILPADWPSA